jgi:uncharacterized protein (TIGR03118 family)
MDWQDRKKRICGETKMENWLKLISTKVRGFAVDGVQPAWFGSWTVALLSRLASAIAVICLLTLFPFAAQAQYTAENLVSSTKLYEPRTIDPYLVDGWGLAALPNSPWWLSAQNTSTSPLYTGQGVIVSELPRVDIACVTDNNFTTTVPCPFPSEGYIDEPNNPSNPKGNTGIGYFGVFGPTGIVANTFSNAFQVSGAPALFIWATQDGLIVAWNQRVSPLTHAVVVANQFTAPPSVHLVAYQGLAIAGPADDPHLYAANLAGGIDVFDKSFKLVNTFVADSNNPRIPVICGGPCFGPYGIQTIGNKLYVTYFSLFFSAGILDVCDLNTSTTNPQCRRLFASNLTGTEKSPTLASPWGTALAPWDFGPLSNELLVGNVDNGLIHAFDPLNGALIGTLNLKDGTPFAVPGLWGLQFGQGNVANGPLNNLFFSSGPSPDGITDPVHVYGAGLFGVIKPAQ